MTSILGPVYHLQHFREMFSLFFQVERPKKEPTLVGPLEKTSLSLPPQSDSCTGHQSMFSLHHLHATMEISKISLTFITIHNYQNLLKMNLKLFQDKVFLSAHQMCISTFHITITWLKSHKT